MSTSACLARLRTGCFPLTPDKRNATALSCHPLTGWFWASWAPSQTAGGVIAWQVKCCWNRRWWMSSLPSLSTRKGCVQGSAETPELAAAHRRVETTPWRLLPPDREAHRSAGASSHVQDKGTPRVPGESAWLTCKRQHRPHRSACPSQTKHNIVVRQPGAPQ